MKQKTLFVVAAGSGGHILPALVLAKKWQCDNALGRVVFLSSNKILDQKILASYPSLARIYTLSVHKFSLKEFWVIPVIILQILLSFLKTFFYVLSEKPEKVISTGGLISLPVCIAARVAGCFVEIHELNVVPGKANRVLMLFAHRIVLTFERSKAFCHFLGLNFVKKCVVKPYPVRFTDQDTQVGKQALIDYVNELGPTGLFTMKRQTIVILGGSQGSVFLNTACKKIFQQHQTYDIQIIHQVGSIDPTDWQAFYLQHTIPALTFSYHQNIKNFYLLADVIICRAGAGTLFEIKFFNKPCIVIPLVADSTSHQVENARALEKEHSGLFTVLMQDDVEKDPVCLEKALIKHLKKNRCQF